MTQRQKCMSAWEAMTLIHLALNMPLSANELLTKYSWKLCNEKLIWLKKFCLSMQSLQQTPSCEMTQSSVHVTLWSILDLLSWCWPYSCQVISTHLILGDSQILPPGTWPSNELQTPNFFVGWQGSSPSNGHLRSVSKSNKTSYCRISQGLHFVFRHLDSTAANVPVKLQSIVII